MWRKSVQVCLLGLMCLVAVEGAASPQEKSNEQGEGSSLPPLQDAPLNLTRTLHLERQARLEAQAKVEGLEKRVAVLEENLQMMILLDSRLRGQGERLDLHAQEITNLQQQRIKNQKGVEQMKRQMRRHRDDVTALRQDSDVAMHRFNLSLHTLQARLLPLNESVEETLEGMLQVEEEQEKLREEVESLQRHCRNVSSVVEAIRTQPLPLLLCPAGYSKVGRDCLRLLQTRRSWEASRAACVREGAAVGGVGDLAQPSNITTFRYYVDQLSTESPFVWVGGERVEGVWRWVSGAELPPLPWDVSEPDNWPLQRHLCLRSSASIKFHDCTATAALAAVCQVA